jgi:ferredoxin-NADP reductase
MFLASPRKQKPIVASLLFQSTHVDRRLQQQSIMMFRFASPTLAVLMLSTVVILLWPPVTAFLYQQQHLQLRRRPQLVPKQCLRQPPPSKQSNLLISLSSTRSEDKNDVISWNDATVVSTRPACSSAKSLLWSIQLDHQDALSLGYTTPGQFLKLRWNETTDPLFLAMCSSPPSHDDGNDKKKTLEFLVKTTPNIPWLTDIEEGATVQVSNVMGDGFAAAAEALKDGSNSSSEDTEDSIDHVLLVAAGSGIAPLMACFRTKKWMDQVTYKTAYYGEWTFDDICFKDELTTEEAGINLVPCFSKQERDFTKGFWSGHVQMVMWQRGVVNPEKTLALVCGPTEMIQDVRQLLTRAGVKSERVVANV